MLLNMFNAKQKRQHAKLQHQKFYIFLSLCSVCGFLHSGNTFYGKTTQVKTGLQLENNLTL